MLCRLGNCEVCGCKPAKYTCPRCEVKTCCLRCNKIHKLELECSGQRDKAKFIQKDKFTNLDLLNDYRFMEEVSRFVGISRKGSWLARKPIKRFFLKLSQQALKRGITLKFLPENFSRHKRNTTKFDVNRQIIDWHVDWVFVNSENYKISEQEVPDNVPISKLLAKYLNSENKVIQEILSYYQTAGLPNIKLLLKAEQRTKGRFFEIDAACTLREALRNKVIVEYPTIFLVFKEQGSFYKIIDSDDEEGEEAKKPNKSGQDVINNMIQKSESDERQSQSQKNLLFVSDNDDDGDDVDMDKYTK